MKFFWAKYPVFLKWLYPKRISRINDTHSIYLTFDDGPIPEVTPWVLDELSKFHAKATFFCIGDNVKKHPTIFRRILEEGHEVGNHTFNHLNGWGTSTSKYLENTLKTEEIMRKTGEEQIQQKANEIPNSERQHRNFKLFRPPYGKIKNSQAVALKKQGYTLVMWDVLSGDYDEKISAEECFQNIIKNTMGGSTIVFHDSHKAYKNLRATLPRVLKHYQEKGFKFRSITNAASANQ